jgi:hypothetical protein
MGKSFKVEKSIREKIDQYLIDNPIETGKPGCYSKVAEKFDIGSEYIRNRYRKLRAKNSIPVNETPSPIATKLGETSLREDVRKGEADFSCVTNKRIKTLEDLIKACEIDVNVWEVLTFEVNKWEVGRKAKEVSLKWKKGVSTGIVEDSGTIFVEPLFQVKAKLSRRKLDKDLGKQKEAVMAELRGYTQSLDLTKVLTKYTKANVAFSGAKKDCALEINIPDLHIGKLSWGEETGDDYDIKIAVARYKSAITELIGRTNISQIERFILVVGHDFLNVDGKNNLTTAGTPQSSDSRFYKMVQVGKKLLIETINELSLISFVDVMVVPGNHDNNSMLLMGDILEAWYHGSDIVNVYNSAAPRKYYQFGKVGIMYAHGHNESLDNLGMIFATENKQMWADTDYHRVHVGHFHHSKQLKYKDINENIGCTVKIISSLSSNDAWHTEKGYLSLKGAEAFLYHRDRGLLANYYYQI